MDWKKFWEVGWLGYYSFKVLMGKGLGKHFSLIKGINWRIRQELHFFLKFLFYYASLIKGGDHHYCVRSGKGD